MPTYESLKGSPIDLAGARPAVRDLVRRFLDADWAGYRMRDGHFRMLPPTPDFPSTTISGTPSDIRSLKNSEAVIARYEKHVEALNEAPPVVADESQPVAESATGSGGTIACPECGKSFGLRTLMLHRARIHSIPSSQCHVCGRLFASAGNRARHESDVHDKKFGPDAPPWKSPQSAAKPTTTTKPEPSPEPTPEPTPEPQGEDVNSIIAQARALFVPELVAENAALRKQVEDLQAKLVGMREWLDA